jgi:hypothetical protein
MLSGIALVISYVISVLALKAIKEEEVKLLPKGALMARILVKRGLLKPQTEDFED